LASRSGWLFVATSKPHVFATRIVEHFGLRHHLTWFGSELDGRRVDKSHLLEYALQPVGVDPSRTLMIGDRSHASSAQKTTACKRSGVLYGMAARRIAPRRREPNLRHAAGDSGCIPEIFRRETSDRFQMPELAVNLS